MKRVVFLLLPVLMLACDVVSANEGPARRRNNDERRRSGNISLPVYAPKTDSSKPQEMTPEQRAKFASARKRRFEIMVLIGAYKIMPVDQRQALKAELLKRIEADFKAMMATQKARIAKAEEELKRLRAEVAEKEANADKLVAREMDRLLSIPMGGRRGPRNNKKNPAGKPAK